MIGVRSSQGPNGEDAVAEETRHAYVAQTPELFTYDLDGNLTSDGRWTYTWDAENRLIEMAPSPVGGALRPDSLRLTFAYDSAGRRIQKKVLNWNGSAYAVASDTRFLYDGWNLLAEYSVQQSAFSLLRSYVWGLDLSGSSQGAGGVGGLLAARSGTATFLPTYDGNGNILGLVNASTGTLDAQYEYGPFGEPLRVTGPAAAANPFGFSTKYQDAETGLLYYGLRYYNPSTGRWPSRDPIGEKGGVNLYGMVGNNPLNRVDLLGLADLSSILDALGAVRSTRIACRCSREAVGILNEMEASMINRYGLNGLLSQFLKEFQKNEKILRSATTASGSPKNVLDSGYPSLAAVMDYTFITAAASSGLAGEIGDMNEVLEARKAASEVWKTGDAVFKRIDQATNMGIAISQGDYIEAALRVGEIGLDVFAKGGGIPGQFFGGYIKAYQGAKQSIDNAKITPLEFIGPLEFLAYSCEEGGGADAATLADLRTLARRF